MRLLQAILAGLLVSGSAAAEDVVPHGAGADDAFAFAPAEGRQLRLDRRTGAMSICAERDGTWSCELIADEKAHYQSEIEALKRENANLTRRVEALTDENADLARRVEALEAPPEPPASETTSAPPAGMARGPTWPVRMFRHFLGVVGNLRAGAAGS